MTNVQNEKPSEIAAWIAVNYSNFDFNSNAFGELQNQIAQALDAFAESARQEERSKAADLVRLFIMPEYTKAWSDDEKTGQRELNEIYAEIADKIEHPPRSRTHDTRNESEGT